MTMAPHLAHSCRLWLAAGENPIKDYVFFGKLRHNEYNGRLYQNFVDMQPQLPANAELVTDPEAPTVNVARRESWLLSSTLSRP